ncbi:MFS transporter [Rhodoferax lacus]|uniref:MFS transporter n=1 Tax=Rhodoferax lacus TaxID=2184758 RepID=A0A3E1RBR6_9BURK|nr:MFS transporter [Rhodoferax lacus]
MPTASGNSLADLFSHRAFARFWLARLNGTTATQMLMVALAWNMYDLTSSAWDLGLVGLFQFVPALLLTLPAGHVADHMHRGRIFACCLFAQALAAVVLLAALYGHFTSRELILGISVLLGMARAFQMPAQQALTPQLVPPALLQRAVTISASAMQAAIIGGPALGGVLYTLGPATVYAVSAMLLIVGGVLGLTVRYDHTPPQLATSWDSVLAGVRFVWHRKVVLGATTLDLFAVLLGGATALLPIFARDLLQTGPIGLGLLRAAPAVGALAMSLALVRWPLERQVGHKLLLAVAVFGLATVVFGLSRSFTVSLLALVVTGAADAVSVVMRSTLVQLETPNEMRGRVSAVNSIFIGASNQLGEFESGAVAALWGPVVSVVSGGIGTMVVAAAWLKLFPTLAQRDELHPKA